MVQPVNSATLVNAARTELQRRCAPSSPRAERRALWRGMLRGRNQLQRAVRRAVVKHAWREMCWQ